MAKDLSLMKQNIQNVPYHLLHVPRFVKTLRSKKLRHISKSFGLCFYQVAPCWVPESFLSALQTRRPLSRPDHLPKTRDPQQDQNAVGDSSTDSKERYKRLNLP